MEQRYETVIVGGGVAGGALGLMLARAGKSVLILEKSVEYPDRVRGEWFAPWGVVEARRIGIYDLLRGAGGHHLKRHVPFGDDIPDVETAEASALDLTALIPGIPGPLCLRHPVICQVLTDAAAAAGATILRGVNNVRVCPGAAPEVTFDHDGAGHRVRCELIVGADGRAGVTRRQAGIVEHADPQHHLFSGLLIENAHGFPEDIQTKGTEGDVNFLVFPQGNGRVRLYLGYASDRKGFLSGPDAPRRFLDAFRLKTLPYSDAIVNATPVSRCYSYPNNDTWVDTPYVEGLVLVGDAAGHNDPITGQGLSISLRDVRIVGESLLSSNSWDTRQFEAYAEERRERMRRLRFAAALQAAVDAVFGPEAEAQRRRIREKRMADPTLSLPLAGVMVGPENIPAEAFTQEVWDRTFA